MKNRILISFIFIITACFAQDDSILNIKDSAELYKILHPYPRKDTNTYFSLVDTNYYLYRLPKNFVKPKKWKKMEEERSKPFHFGYEAKYPDSMDLKMALAYIDHESEFDKVCMAKTWCLDHPTQAFPCLIARLGRKYKVGLTNTADLIIWDRMNFDLQFYGHGGVIGEDLFTIAGRCSWILNSITGEEFAEVHANLTQTQAKQIKKMWVSYLQKLVR